MISDDPKMLVFAGDKHSECIGQVIEALQHRYAIVECRVLSHIGSGGFPGHFRSSRRIVSPCENWQEVTPNRWQSERARCAGKTDDTWITNEANYAAVQDLEHGTGVLSVRRRFEALWTPAPCEHLAVPA
jgi:hypothetical protein